jgi:hypothetical protein
MKDLIIALTTWIAANSPYDIPQDFPVIEYQPAAVFEASSCTNTIHCATRAYYEDGTGKIVLHEVYRDTENARARSMLVHEIVHYLQDINGHPDNYKKTCEIWLEREQEAFRLQYLYLVKETGNYHLYMPVLDAAKCQNQQG